MVPYLYLTDQEPFRFFFSCLSLSLSLFRTRGFFGEIGDWGICRDLYSWVTRFYEY